MNQKEWYLKILEWAEKDDRLNLGQMQAVVLAEHLANDESGLTKRVPDALSTPRIPCTCGQDDGLHEWDCAISRARR